MSDNQAVKPNKMIFGRLMHYRALIFLIVLFLLEAFFVPRFLTTTNLLNVLRQVSITGIAAVGMTYVIITAGIDISIGSTVALGGILAGLVLHQGGGVALAILTGILGGLAVGLFNGVLIAYAGAMPFVITLGSMYVFRGVTLILSGGQAIWGFPDNFVYIGTGYFLGIPVPVIIMALIYLAGHVVLTRFKYGRYVQAIGGDEEAARRCGVNIKLTKMFTYGFCGALASFSGVILAGRLGSGQPGVGTGYELIAIAATVIGGTSLLGGIGTVAGTLVGTIILGMLSNALNLLGVAPFFQTVITGSMVIIAVLADTIKLRR